MSIMTTRSKNENVPNLNNIDNSSSISHAYSGFNQKRNAYNVKNTQFMTAKTGGLSSLPCMTAQKNIHNDSELINIDKQYGKAHVRTLNLTQTLQLNRRSKQEKHNRNGAAVNNSMQDPNSNKLMNQTGQGARNSMFMSLEGTEAKQRNALASSIGYDAREEKTEATFDQMAETNELNFGTPARYDKLPFSKGCDESIEVTKEFNDSIAE